LLIGKPEELWVFRLEEMIRDKSQIVRLTCFKGLKNLLLNLLDNPLLYQPTVMAYMKSGTVDKMLLEFLDTKPNDEETSEIRICLETIMKLKAL
jgi:hypothetical protein